MIDDTRKYTVITGASFGIGYETAKKVMKHKLLLFHYLDITSTLFIIYAIYYLHPHQAIHRYYNHNILIPFSLAVLFLLL